MLEFLYDVDINRIYDRAMACQNSLKDFDCNATMAMLTEALLKVIYDETYENVSRYELNNLKLVELLRDSDFVSVLKDDYRLHDKTIKTLDHIMRSYSNKQKHFVFLDDEGDDPDDYTVKNCFRSVYYLAAAFYNHRADDTAPLWSDREYEEMLDSIFDEEARAKLEKEYSGEITKLQEEIKAQKQEKAEYNRTIDKLTEELEKAKNNSVDKEELEKLQNQLKALSVERDWLESERVTLRQNERNALQDKQRIEKDVETLKKRLNELTEEEAAKQSEKIAELEEQVRRYSTTADQLNADNNALKDRITGILTEKALTEKKLEELQRCADNTEKADEIERKLLEAKAEKAAIESRISEANGKLKDLEGKIYVASSELEKLFENYNEERRKKSKADVYLSKNAPLCPNCSSPLKLKPSQYDNGYYWACPKWRKDGTGCKGYRRSVYARELPIVDEYLNILGGYSIEPKEYKVSEEYLKKQKPATPTYRSYPESMDATVPARHLFRSITVPEEVFSQRSENKVRDFASFTIQTKQREKQVPEKERTVYSLLLRLLNRGSVLKISAQSDADLRNRFHVKEYGTVNSLFESIHYREPFMLCDSDREVLFAHNVFPRLLGNNWASYVQSQVPIEFLAPEDSKDFIDQRVDFVIFRNEKKIVVELDGPEHYYSRFKDENRDRLLSDHGYIVKRFSNAIVDSELPRIIEDLKEEIGAINDITVETDVDDKYLIACKFCHQFAIAIVKALESGYTTVDTNIKAFVSTDLFNDSEIKYILSVAEAEVSGLIKNYADIYGLELKVNFSDSSKPEFPIYIGDGSETMSVGLLIRDCIVPYDFLCEIKPFSEKYDPEKINEDNLLYIQEYIFGDKEFRPGQYDAIRRFLKKKDTIVLLPTGAGKSRVYQLSSYIVPGIILVVAPLRSLIEDQIINLERYYGINNAVYFISGQTKAEKARNNDAQFLMQHNSTSLIYVAPERLLIPKFRNVARNMLLKNSVFGVAIDEAHCVSEWGHDFRPAYLNLGNSAVNLFTKNGKRPVLFGLTGTASDAVLNDVRLDLGIQGRDALIQPDNFTRKELHFSVQKCSALEKPDRIAKLIKKDIPEMLGTDYSDLAELKGEETKSGIVFTPLAKNAISNYSSLKISDLLKSYLPELGIGTYFSNPPDGIDSETWSQMIKEAAQKYKDNQLNLLVATKAFGMGIDKPNIRYIIHDGLPQSFEQYYQEAGRAARDRKKAECVLVFSNDNDDKNLDILSDSPIEDFKNRYYSYAGETKFDKADDVSSMLFFHNSSFKGIEYEKLTAYDLLDRIREQGFSEGKEVTVFMSLEREEKDENGRVMKYRSSKTGSEKEWMQALVRLIILGAVKDYTYDYAQTFTIICGTLDKEKIAQNYGNYVRGSKPDAEKEILDETNKIREIKSTGVDMIKEAIPVLLKFIYNNIERSRRRTMLEMYNAIKEASDKEGEDQNDYLQQQITRYFVYNGKNRDELGIIEKSKTAGFELIPDMFVREKLDEDQIEHARDIYVLSGRLLESRPDHPGLLLAQANGRMAAGDYNSRIVVNDCIAAFTYGKRNYYIDDAMFEAAAFGTMDRLLDFSYRDFDEVMGVYCSSSGLKALNVYDRMLQSDRISEQHKTYLLTCYASELLNQSTWRN